MSTYIIFNVYLQYFKKYRANPIRDSLSKRPSLQEFKWSWSVIMDELIRPNNIYKFLWKTVFLKNYLWLGQPIIIFLFN